MDTDALKNDPELQHILWACYEYWRQEKLPVRQRAICYNWVIDVYKDRFDQRFHQSKLTKLARLGFLKKDYPTRAGSRRYYKIPAADQIEVLLKEWRLTQP